MNEGTTETRANTNRVFQLPKPKRYYGKYIFAATLTFSITTIAWVEYNERTTLANRRASAKREMTEQQMENMREYMEQKEFERKMMEARQKAEGERRGS